MFNHDKPPSSIRCSCIFSLTLLSTAAFGRSAQTKVVLCKDTHVLAPKLGAVGLHWHGAAPGFISSAGNPSPCCPRLDYCLQVRMFTANSGHGCMYTCLPSQYHTFLCHFVMSSTGTSSESSLAARNRWCLLSQGLCHFPESRINRNHHPHDPS